MKKALVTMTEDGSIASIDVMEHAGSNWLVPTWLENPVEGHKIPERIVCLDALHHQKVAYGEMSFVVNAPIPKSVLFGNVQLPPDAGYVVIHRPDIRIPIPRGVH